MQHPIVRKPRSRWSTLLLEGIAVLLAAVVTAAVTAAPTSARGAGPYGTDDVPERILVFTAGGPLVVELRISIDGRPFRQVREALIDELMAAAGAEEGRPKWKDALAHPRLAQDPREFTQPVGMTARQERIERYDTNRDGYVDRGEMQRFVEAAQGSGAPFRLTGSSFFRTANRLRSGLGRVLDVDQDGALSREELDALEERVKRYDQDDDDLIMLADVNPTLVATAGQPNSQRQQYGAPPALILDEQTYWSSVARWFDELYGLTDPPDGAALPLWAYLYRSLDADGDGQVLLDELSRLTEIEADVALTVSFGAAAGQSAGIESLWLSPRLRRCEHSLARTGNGWTLQLAETKLLFDSADNSAYDAMGLIRPQFDALDTNRDGVIEPDELETAGANVERLFAAADADEDGQLSVAELAEFYRAWQGPRLSQVTVEVSDDPDAVFALLDTSHDGRLSLRELRRAAARLARFDRRRDGSLRFGDLPGSITLRLQRGTAMAAPGQMAALPAMPESSGPGWFQHMDRNRDGELAPREFLGTAAQFDALDTDGDGFLEAEEAAQAESLATAEVP